MPNQDGSLTFEEAVGAGPSPGQEPSSDGSLSFEEASGQQPAASPVDRATSATAAAVKEPILSEEFTSGALFRGIKENVGPALEAVRRAVLPTEEENPALYQQGTAAQRAAFMARAPALHGLIATDEQYAKRLNQVPGTEMPIVGEGGVFTPEDMKTAGEAANLQVVPPQLNPLWWQGQEALLAGRVLNPKGPLGPVRTALDVGGGAAVGTAKAAAGMMTPLNVGLAVATPAGLAEKAVALTFLGQAIVGTPAQIARLKAAPGMAEKAEIAAEMVASYLPALAFKFRRIAKEAKAEEVTKAAEPGGEAETAPRVAMKREDFLSSTHEYLNELRNKSSLTPAEAKDLQDIEHGLGEHGDITKLAASRHVDLSDVEPTEPTTEAAAGSRNSNRSSID